MPNNPVRWGVLGGGSRVFARRMVPAFAHADNAELVAVASRSLSAAQEVAQKHTIPRAYGSYDALLTDPDVEAVYLPLPNDLHPEWAIRCFEAGKHVLCDKPAALTYADASRMVEAANNANLRLMEGFMCRHHPQHEWISGVLRRGEIGPPVRFSGVFSYPATGENGGIRWNPEQGGGAFWDVGVYPVNLARYVFAGEPVAVFAQQVTDAQTGVDTHTLALLEFLGGRSASIVGAFDQAFTSRYEIAGRDGVITAERAFQVGENGVNVTVRKGDDITTQAFPHVDHWRLEIEHFSACVRDASKALFPGENGIAQARVCSAIARSGREKRRVELSEIQA